MDQKRPNTMASRARDHNAYLTYGLLSFSGLLSFGGHSLSLFEEFVYQCCLYLGLI
ncbi:MAG: hypothetical protein AAF843_01535 [Bacteroidota bacterium]